DELQELAHRDLDRPRSQQPALDQRQDDHRDEQIDQRKLGLLPYGKFHRKALSSCYRRAPNLSNMHASQVFVGGFCRLLKRVQMRGGAPPFELSGSLWLSRDES